MTEPEKNTEQQILNAAKTVFLKKGFDGARMQEIADEAGMNKALLHYYFRSKDKLFDAIFQEAFQQFLPRVSEIMTSDKPFFEKIWAFVESYIDMLLENPHLPMFILNELYRHPERLVNIVRGFGIQPELFALQMKKEIEAGNIHPVDPRHFMVTMLGLCIFPFAARPMIQRVLFENNAEEYQKFLLQRKTEVTLFIMNALTPK